MENSSERRGVSCTEVLIEFKRINNNLFIFPLNNVIRRKKRERHRTNVERTKLAKSNLRVLNSK